MHLPSSTPELTRRHCGGSATYLLFVCVDQLLIIPVPELPRGFRCGQGGVEEEQLSGTVCSLETVTGKVVGRKVLRESENQLKQKYFL